MRFGLFLRILKARFRLIASILLITLGSAAAASFLMARIYSPSAVLFVDVKGLDPVLGGSVFTPQSVRGVLATQAEIVQSDRVVYGVIRELGLDRRQDVVDAWQRNTGGSGDIVRWLAKGMVDNLIVKPSNEGSTLTLTYEGKNGREATDIVNAFARQYLQAALSLRADPAKQSAVYFEQQLAAYREQLKAAQAKTSAFQQASGIVASEERLDIENQRLQELSSQLVAVQSQAVESRSRSAAIGRTGRDAMPEVVQNALVQSLRTDLSRAEAKLQELSSRLGPNHPQYQSAQAEVESLRARLNTETDRVSRSIVASSQVNAQREAEIRGALEAQRTRVLRLKKDYDQLAGLRREVDEAQKAIELVAQRLTQTNLESKAPQSNASLLAPALVPSEPSRPKPVLNMVVGAFAGLMLGVLAALSLEAFKRPVRTAEDLMQVVAVPVLAVLPPSNTRRAQRLIGNTGPTITPPHLRLGN